MKLSINRNKWLVAIMLGIFLSSIVIIPGVAAGAVNLSTTATGGNVGEEIDIPISVDTIGIKNFDLPLIYDPTKLQPVSITPGTIASAFNPVTNLAYGANEVYINGASLNGTTATGIIATFKFRILAAGATTITLDQDYADFGDGGVNITGVNAFSVTLTNILGPVAPVASNVAIAGTAQVGQTLTGSYTYADANNDIEAGTLKQWFRCDTADAEGTAITGATDSSYTLVGADRGKFIKFGVTPMNATDPTTGTLVKSAATAQVTPSANVPSVANVTITGSKIVGSTVTAAYTITDDNAYDDSLYTYKWYRGAAADTVTDLIATATAKTYTVDAADDTKYLKVEVTPVSPAGTGTPVLSTAFGPISTTPAPPVAANVSITGGATARVGVQLTGAYDYSDPNGDPEAGSTYKWYRCDTADAAGTAITGATSLTYTPVAADLGKFLKFEVTPINAADSNTTGTAVKSAATAAVLEAYSSTKDITAFSFQGLTPAVVGTIGTDTVTLTVPYGTNVTALVPTITVSPNATVSPASGAAQNFTNPVAYTVTAQDTTTKVYTVTVNIAAPSTNNNLSGITLDGAALTGFAAGTLSYAISLPAGTTTVPVVAATKADDTASVSITQATNTTGTVQERTATITVTAQSGATKVYTVVFTPKAFTIAASGALDTSAGITAAAIVTPSATFGHSGNEVVIFQLMKGTTPVSIVALTKDITAAETLTAQFSVPTSFSSVAGSYSVKVFVLDTFTSSLTNAPESLAAPITIQ